MMVADHQKCWWYQTKHWYLGTGPAEKCLIQCFCSFINSPAVSWLWPAFSTFPHCLYSWIAHSSRFHFGFSFFVALLSSFLLFTAPLAWLFPAFLWPVWLLSQMAFLLHHPTSSSSLYLIVLPLPFSWFLLLLTFPSLTSWLADLSVFIGNSLLLQLLRYGEQACWFPSVSPTHTTI